jgi:hypothetical protein
MPENDSKKQKKNRVIPLRQAGITVNDSRERPSKLLFEEVLRQEEHSTEKPPTPPTPLTEPTPLTKNSKKIKLNHSTKTEVSPVKDYQKVANSIVREVIPTGIFIGKSKHIYDSLYLLTRGAITPKRSVRITKKLLMAKAGVGSERTLLKNLSHLKNLGLLKIIEYEGQHEGNEYEILLPEEVIGQPTPPHSPHSPYSPQKVGTLPPVESGVGGVSLITENTGTYASSKTYFKDSLNDDEKRLLLMTINLLNDAAKRATGKDLTPKDFEALKEIAEIIISETDLARTRTHSVSVYLKLAAENLRRRLYSRKPETKFKNNLGGKNWSEVGKNKNEADEYDEQGNYIPEPLDEHGRKAALELIGEYQARGASFEEYERFYTPEDWKWLMENLPEKKKESEDQR